VAELASDADVPELDAIAHPTPEGDSAGDATERELRARIAELEALLEARTHAIVGLGARLAELQGDAPPPLAGRVHDLELELQQLRATKVLRWSAIPRRIYARVRRG
jgi:hypothetical protein